VWTFPDASAFCACTRARLTVEVEAGPGFNSRQTFRFPVLLAEVFNSEENTMLQKRAYRYRFYPTDEQQQQLARTFGCVRFVYNWALRLLTEVYQQQGKRLYYGDTSAALTQLKKQPETAWLNDVSAVPLQQALRHLDRAFVNFFEGRASYPTFHKKHGVQSATYVGNGFKWDGISLTLGKIEASLAIRWSRLLPKKCKITSVAVSKDTANRYFVSILVEEEIVPLLVTPQTVGLDMGITSLVALSTGEKVGNPQYFRQDEKKLARAQRRLAKKRKGSKNRDKARHKVARIHARIADRRRDYQHKLSTRMVRENQVICVETLNVKGMLQNRHLAKSISDVGWGELVRQLEYKSAWYGRALIKIDRWEPSSKRCSACGYVVDKLPLDVREWVCPECGVCHDRDINAANNIRAAGLAVYACEGAVRPARAQVRSGTRRRSRNASS
jgi:putative transposase